MRLVGPALKDERLSSAAPGAERASSSSGLALLSSPPGEERDRSTRPVAILRIARFWPSGHRATPITNPAAGLDGLEAFGSEFPVSTDTRQAASTPGSSSLAATSALPKQAVVAGKWIAVALLGASLTAAAFLVYQRRVAAKPTTGVLSVETVPTGLEVSVAGKVVGKTPLAVALPAGSYDVQIGQVPNQRVLKLALGAGATVMQHVEMPAPPAPAIESGSLRILTEPAKLPVLIDGVERGLSPLTVDQIQSGDHEVSVRSPGGALHRTVTVRPRETVSLIVSSAIAPIDKSIVSAGWLSVGSPVPLQLLENGKVIGSTESDRVMLPAGEHTLTLANASLGFHQERTVHVNAGKTTTTSVELPNGTISLNATPWAEVFVDGERVGETPIGNLSRPIGRHEVIFRNPQLGDHHETVFVTVEGTVRLGVDLRKK